MTPYTLLLKSNLHLISGGVFTAQQNQNVTANLLKSITPPMALKRFHEAVNAPKSANGDTREMYPLYYIPPYNDGKKIKTVTGVTPATHILAANSYELEILRILHICGADNVQVSAMLERTKARILTTCFGQPRGGHCWHGECAESVLVTLRYFAACFASERAYISGIMDEARTHLYGKKRNYRTHIYYWLILSELPDEMAIPEIRRCCEDVLARAAKKCAVVGDENDNIRTRINLFAMRNCLARLGEYAYLRDRTLMEADGRVWLEL